jgi:putative flippase GtrA
MIPVTKQSSCGIKTVLIDIRTILYAITFGILFGFFMNKGTVFVAPTIRMQMLFQRFAMFKMFLAAAGASMLSVALLVLCCNTLYGKILNNYIEHNSRRDSKRIEAFN